MLLNTASPTAVLVGFLTGVALLLYGVRLVSDALQRVINGRIQQALTRLSNYPLAGFGIGLVATALMQSSTTMATLLVELVSANLLPLSIAIVMALGANVGSTLVVQLLVLHITDFALPLLGLGVVVALFTHRNPIFRRPGRVLFAFSLILLGLAVVGVASQPIADNGTTKALLLGLGDENARLVLIVIGAGLSLLFNSSAVTIGLVLTLAANGALEPTSALVVVLGANVGTTPFTILAALNGGTLVERRLALVQSGTKLLGAVVLLFLIVPVAALLQEIWPDAGTQVAMAHMSFNLALALIFAPLSGTLARLMERLLPEKDAGASGASSGRSLDQQALGNPSVAQGLATRETLRMADLVTTMLELAMQAFEEGPDALKEQIKAMDDQLDELNVSIKGYLTQLDEEIMTEEQQRQDIFLLTVTSDLEAIGDVMTHRVMHLARRRSRNQIVFSEDGWQDLLSYYQQAKEALHHVMAGLATHNRMLVTKFLAHEEELKETRRNLHLRHIRELRADIPNSMASSVIYLDLLDAMTTILSHISNMAYAFEEANRPSTSAVLRRVNG